MDIQQLQLLAGRIRDLVQQQSNHPIGHSQSLDLVAALPGLRNWPEVRAFPKRVLSCELDESSVSRLTFRLKKRLGLDLSVPDVLDVLRPERAEGDEGVPEIWPSGPEPGVYVTTSQTAIDALLAKYDEATDGALVYAERAGSGWDGAIDLGEGGLWSSGLNRVPSGTLLVVGPLEVNQQEWQDSAERLEMACLRAQNAGHRVAVLLDSPSLADVCEDVHLMVRSVQQEGDDCEDALLGVVTEVGELEHRVPFCRPWPRPIINPTTATVEAIPTPVIPILTKALAARTSGLLLFGSSRIEEHWAIDLVTASLALTEHMGPAARIMPRKRGTPAKDWQVPEPIAQLPFLPSIQSAYARGYRRLLINPAYGNAEPLLEYAEKSLLIAGCYGAQVEEIFTSVLRFAGFHNESAILGTTIAMLGVTAIPTKHGSVPVSDLFVMREDRDIPALEFERIGTYIQRERTLKWEDAVGRLLDEGETTISEIKQNSGRNYNLSQFLATRGGADGEE